MFGFAYTGESPALNKSGWYAGFWIVLSFALLDTFFF
jgi:hypothetical protein